MKIEFSTPTLKALCEEERLMVRSLGKAGAKKLKSRLADLVAASTLAEIVAGRPHPLKGDRLGEFALDLRGGYRLILVPIDPMPKTKDDAIDWYRVNQIRIMSIEDYHD